MIEDLISNFLHLILDFVIYITNFILVPFDLLINNFFPTYIEDSISFIVNAFDTAFYYLFYILDSVGFESFTILLFTDYIIFKITVPLGVSVVKIAIRWYNNLKT